MSCQRRLASTLKKIKMKPCLKIIGCSVVLSSFMCINSYADVTGSNTTLASRTVDAAVIKKSHEALCEQMGGIEVVPEPGSMTVGPETQDAVLCVSTDPNNAVMKAMEKGVVIRDPGDIVLGPVPQKEIDRLNQL